MKKYFTKFIICIIYISLIYSKISLSSNWKLEIKDEKGSDDQITLKAGLVKKITLIVSHQNDVDQNSMLDTTFDDTNFTISIDDEDGVKFYPNNEFNIIPSINLEYTTYLGLKCNHKIQNEYYEVKPYVKYVKDLKNNEKINSTLEISSIKVKVDSSPSILELESIETNLTQKGLSLFKLKSEIYNMKKIEISIKEEKDKFVFTDIQIEDLNERYQLGEDENHNHGILFKYPFGTQYSLSDLNNETNKTFNLVIKESSNSKCFELSDISVY